MTAERMFFDRLSRRTLLGGAAGLGATLLAPGRFAQAQAPKGSATPKRGGTLRVTFDSAPDSLDPQATLAAAGQQVSSLVFDNLTWLDNDGNAMPMLATKWYPENNGTEWVFELRQDVKFHHGKDFTSEDVVATLERAQTKSLGLWSYGVFGPYKAIKAEGPHKVRLVLTQPFAEVPVLAAGRWARIIPADRIEQLKTEPVGTGPFLFKEFQPNSSVTVVRNPNYWMPNAPYLDGVYLVAVKDSVAQQAALRGGSVDLITKIPVEAYLALKSVAGIQTHSITTGQYQMVMTQANLAPFDNPLVRKAFKYILNRKPLIASALLGQGSLGNDMPLPPTSPYLPKVEQHDQDLAKAKALLEEAKVGPLNLELFTSSERPPSQKIALSMKQEAAKLGIEINVRDIPFTEYASNVSRKKPFYTVQWSTYPTLYDNVYLMYRSGASRNYGGVENAPGLDALLDNMISEFDEAKRKAIIQQVAAKIHENGERIIPYFHNYFCANSDKVHGFTPPKYDIVEMRQMWLS